jgi:ABC-type uncharacterized transport system ATPase subunit
MKNITKTFPGTIANDQVDLDLFPNEIHVIMGENGAGKTTLMNVLYGMYRPDSGEIYVDGKQAKIRSPVDAQALGIGMVFQHFSLIEVFTVLENFVIGRKGSKISLNLSKLQSKIEDAERNYGISMDLSRKVQELSIAEKQKAEILKVLFMGARVLILDEPTSMLTPQESSALFKNLHAFKDQGKSVVLITHKLYEILEVADRVTVLRKGRVVLKSTRKDLTQSLLAEATMGRSMTTEEFPRDLVSAKGTLSIKNLSVRGDRGEEAVSSATFDVQRGEILGVAGIAGNGQKELVEAIVGLRKTRSGEIVLEGDRITGRTVRDRMRRGLRYIPEDRKRRSVAIDLSLTYNAVLRDHWLAPFDHNHILNFSAMREFAKKIISGFGVVCSSESSRAEALSGGNLQKFIVGRELLRVAQYIIAENPTAGLDIASTQYVRRTLIEHRNAGNGIILLSGDLDELIAMSDRIIVIYRGRTNNAITRKDFDKLKIGDLMLGREFQISQGL